MSRYKEGRGTHAQVARSRYRSKVRIRVEGRGSHAQGQGQETPGLGQVVVESAVDELLRLPSMEPQPSLNTWGDP